MLALEKTLRKLVQLAGRPDGAVYSLTSLSPLTAPVTNTTLGGQPADTTAYRHGLLAVRNPAGSGKRVVPISAVVHGHRSVSGGIEGGWASAVLRFTAGTGSYLSTLGASETAPTYAAAAPGAVAEAYVATGNAGEGPTATPESPPLYVRAGSLARVLATGQVPSRGTNLGGECTLDFRDVCSAGGLYLAEGEILVVKVKPDGTSYSVSFTWAEVDA